MSNDGDRGVYAGLGESLKHILADGGKEVKYALQRWDRTYKLQIDRAEKKRTRVVNAKAELYQLISLYVVFQGVVLTTVAKASNLKCHTSYVPALFSALVSIAASFGLHDRLLFYYDTQSALTSEEAKAMVTNRKINYVLTEGARFKFENMDKEWPPQQDPVKDIEIRPLLGVDLNQESAGSAGKRRGPAQSKRDPEKHYWLVMAFLIVFSALVFINCFILLCSN